MSFISPEGPVYQAGTLSGNPAAMSAGIAQLKECLRPGFYEDQEIRTKFFVEKINSFAKSKSYNFELITIGSIFWISFNKEKTIKRADEVNSDMNMFKSLFWALIDEGVYIGPSGYEVGFISQSHTKKILNKAVKKFCRALDKIYN